MCQQSDKWQHSALGRVLLDDNLKLRENWEAAGGIFVHRTADLVATQNSLFKALARAGTVKADVQAEEQNGRLVPILSAM